MVKDTEIPELISLKEACEILKVHANTLRNWDRKGILKAVRIGEKKIRRYYFSFTDIFMTLILSSTVIIGRVIILM